MPKHRAGGKFAGSHSTVIDAAIAVVDTAARESEVSKIVLGIIEGVKSKKSRLKFRPVPAGWEVKVYGKLGLQTLYVYTSNTDKTKSAIEKVFK